MKWFWKKNSDEEIARQNWEMATELKLAVKEVELWKERGDRLLAAYDARTIELQQMQNKFTQMVSNAAYVKAFSEGVRVMGGKGSDSK